MHIQPMINVKDVEHSSRFYQQVLDCSSGHGGNKYEKIMFGETLVLQLHALKAPEHPQMWKSDGENGNGVVLWFRTDDFVNAVARVRQTDAQIVEEPQINPNSRMVEIWFRDPDGYMVALCSKNIDPIYGALPERM